MLTILDEINGKFIPPAPLPPKSRMGKMARFGFYAAFTLDCGGWGLSTVPFYFVQDCRWERAQIRVRV